MRSSIWRARLVALLALTAVFGAAAAMLPDNPYERWQLLDGTIHRRARWIYERIHYDPTPIDIAFVGPSRIEAGVNSKVLEYELAKRGMPAHVVNFALPENGRNLNKVIVEEMLKTKRPKLIVVGVIEKPSRYGHPAFKYVAPAWDIADPGYFGDLYYFEDLIYLPFRQLKLFAARFIPGLVGLDPQFDPSKYLGTVVDTTGDKLLPGGQIKNGTKPASAAELYRGVHKLEAGMNPPLLPDRYRDLEFGDERHYIREIVGEAQAKGAAVAFLFLPYYTGPAELQEARFYARFGPIWSASTLAHRPELYADYGHLTSDGAVLLTSSVAGQIVTFLKNRGETPNTPALQMKQRVRNAKAEATAEAGVQSLGKRHVWFEEPVHRRVEGVRNAEVRSY